MKLNKFLILFIVTLTIIISSCNVFKKSNNIINSDINDSIPAKTDVNKPHINNNDAINLLKNQANYQWFSSRVKALITNDTETQSVIIFVVNKKDSILYFNISKFAIEISRAVLTPDSVKFMNKLDMTYYVGDYSIFPKRFGVSLNFNMIQSIFIASDFNQFDYNFNVVDTDSTIIFNHLNRLNKKDNIKINQTYTYTKQNSTIFSDSIEDVISQQKAIITYSQYQIIDNIKFPQFWQIEIPGIKMKAQFLNESLRFNIEGPTSIRIPDRYKPISFN